MKNKMTILKCELAIILFGLTLSSQAAVVALYDFPVGQGTTLPSASTDGDAFSTAGALSLAPFAAPSTGFALTGATSSGISSTSGDPVNSLFLRTTNNSTEANAVLFEKYFTFTLTPASTLDFTSLDFDYFRQTTSSATSFAVRTDAGGDNFTTTIASGTMTGSSTWNNVSLDLTGVSQLQDVTTATTFRVYVWGASGGSSETQIIRFDNIELNAAVVPEPGAGLLLLAGGLGLLALRRVNR